MQVVAVPCFIGRYMDGFTVPESAVTLTPNLPGEAVAYDTSHAGGPNEPAQRRMAVLYDELAGLQRKSIDPTLYWFDAHGDFHTWETTGSDFLGGMPLAMLSGRGEQTIVEATGLRPLADQRIVLVDARDLDRGEEAPGGPSADAVRGAVANLAATGRVVAASVSSWNPALPNAERAAAVTRSIMGVFEG